MRPKKRIVYVDANDARQSIRRFLLETRGYTVMQARSGEEAMEQLAWLQHEIAQQPNTLDLLLIEQTFPGADALIALALIQMPSLPCLKVNTHTNTELMEAIAAATCRRRGPKKQMPSTPLSRAATPSWGHGRSA